MRGIKLTLIGLMFVAMDVQASPPPGVRPPPEPVKGPGPGYFTCQFGCTKSDIPDMQKDFMYLCKKNYNADLPIPIGAQILGLRRAIMKDKTNSEMSGRMKSLIKCLTCESHNENFLKAYNDLESKSMLAAKNMLLQNNPANQPMVDLCLQTYQTLKDNAQDLQALQTKAKR